MKDHHLHLCEAIAPEQKDPCEDIGKALKHNHSLVPGNSGCFLIFFVLPRAPGKICEEEDEDKEAEVGVGPHRVDLVVELVLGEEVRVGKEVVPDEICAYS